MIQRIQSIFLLLVVVCMGITIGTELWEQVVNEQTWKLNAFVLENLDANGEAISSTSKWYLGALASFAGLLALISIFQYKNRGRQMMLNMINSLFMVALVALTFLTTNGLNSELGMEVSGSYKIGFWTILGGMVFNMLANRFIRKDEMLVRSVDRIR